MLRGCWRAPDCTVYMSMVVYERATMVEDGIWSISRSYQARCSSNSNVTMSHRAVLCRHPRSPKASGPLASFGFSSSRHCCSRRVDSETHHHPLNYTTESIIVVVACTTSAF
jgi:hypothetical protein